jgi:hypothetical protein
VLSRGDAKSNLPHPAAAKNSAAVGAAEPYRKYEQKAISKHQLAQAHHQGKPAGAE